MTIQKKIILIVGILVILLIILNVLLGQRTTQPPQKPFPTTIPTPTTFIVNPSPTSFLNPPIPAQEEKYRTGNKKFELQNEAIRKEQQGIIRFKASLPYNGKYITVTYDISVNDYNVSINKNFQTEGEQELQKLLDSYGIKRSSLDINIK